MSRSGASEPNHRDQDPPPPPDIHLAVYELLRRSEDSRQKQDSILEALVQQLGRTSGSNNDGGGGGRNQGYPAFMATHPPEFHGTKDPLDADHFLSEIEDKFGLIVCSDSEKVNFAGHQLKGSAGIWWKNHKAQRGAGHVFTWEEFRTAFRDFHIPESILELKRDEFMALKQGKR